MPAKKKTVTPALDAQAEETPQISTEPQVDPSPTEAPKFLWKIFMKFGTGSPVVIRRFTVNELESFLKDINENGFFFYDKASAKFKHYSSEDYLNSTMNTIIDETTESTDSQ